MRNHPRTAPCRRRAALWAGLLACCLALPSFAADGAEAAGLPKGVLAVVGLAPADQSLPALEAFLRASLKDTPLADKVLPGERHLATRHLLPEPLASAWKEGPVYFVMGDSVWPEKPPFALVLTLADDAESRARMAKAGLFIRAEANDKGVFPVYVAWDERDGDDWLEEFTADEDPEEEEADDEDDANAYLRFVGGRAVLVDDEAQSLLFLDTLAALLKDWTPAAYGAGEVLVADLDLGATFAKNRDMMNLGPNLLPVLSMQYAQKLREDIARLEAPVADVAADAVDDEDEDEEPATQAARQKRAAMKKALLRYVTDGTPWIAGQLNALIEGMPTLGSARLALRTGDEALWTSLNWQPTPGGTLAALLREVPIPEKASDLAARLPLDTLMYSEAFDAPDRTKADTQTLEATTAFLKELGGLIDPEGDLDEKFAELHQRLIAATLGVTTISGSRPAPEGAALADRPLRNTNIIVGPKAGDLGGVLEDGSALFERAANKLLEEFQANFRVVRHIEEVAAEGDRPALREMNWDVRETPGVNIGIDPNGLRAGLGGLRMAWHAKEGRFVVADLEGIGPLLANLAADKAVLGERAGFALALPGQERTRGMVGYYLADLTNFFTRLFVNAIGAMGPERLEKLNAVLTPGEHPALLNMRTGDGFFAMDGYLPAAAGAEIVRRVMGIMEVFDDDDDDDAEVNGGEKPAVEVEIF